jgi:hypothetical protein
MVDSDEITKRLDQLERTQAQQLEHIEKKIDLHTEQISWISKVDFDHEAGGTTTRRCAHFPHCVKSLSKA